MCMVGCVMQRKWQVLLVTAVAVFMGFLDVTIVNIAFPDIEASFPSASLAGLSWILNAYNIVFAALLVPAGRLADRVGRRRMFLGGLVTFLAASAACGLAPSVEVLVTARVVQAAGAVAAATGPSLGGVLVDAASWRWVFFVNLLIGLAALVPARRLLRESREGRPGPLPDGLGGALLVAGVVLLVLLAVRSGRHPAPVVELSLFRVRSFAVADAGVFLFAVGFYALLLANVLFLTRV